MDKNFIQITKVQNNFRVLKGKYTPIQVRAKLIQPEKIITFDSRRALLPFVCFHGTAENLFGTVIARQSSDILVKIAKKLIILEKSENFNLNLMQYRFPKETASLKLIIFCSWDDHNNFEQIKEKLQAFQKEFLHKVQKLVDLVF
jgi:hypothetical protein